MKELFREYRDGDYEACEELVNQAWGFDNIFSSKALSNIAKHIYTKGSVLGSNYRLVVEVEGNVVGFIFGLNAYSKRPGRNILFGLSLLWKLIFIKSSKPDKNDLINALRVHEKNRTDIVDRGRSEIILFVISDEYQGKGYGKRLWQVLKSSVLNLVLKRLL